MVGREARTGRLGVARGRGDPVGESEVRTSIRVEVEVIQRVRTAESGRARVAVGREPDAAVAVDQEVVRVGGGEQPRVAGALGDGPLPDLEPGERRRPCGVRRVLLLDREDRAEPVLPLRRPLGLDVGRIEHAALVTRHPSQVARERDVQPRSTRRVARGVFDVLGAVELGDPELVRGGEEGPTDGVVVGEPADAVPADVAQGRADRRPRCAQAGGVGRLLEDVVHREPDPGPSTRAPRGRAPAGRGVRVPGRVVEILEVSDVERPLVEQGSRAPGVHCPLVGRAADELVDAPAEPVVGGVEHDRLAAGEGEVAVDREGPVLPAGAAECAQLPVPAPIAAGGGAPVPASGRLARIDLAEEAVSVHVLASGRVARSTPRARRAGLDRRVDELAGIEPHARYEAAVDRPAALEVAVPVLDVLLGRQDRAPRRDAARAVGGQSGHDPRREVLPGVVARGPGEALARHGQEGPGGRVVPDVGRAAVDAPLPGRRVALDPHPRAAELALLPSDERVDLGLGPDVGVGIARQEPGAPEGPREGAALAGRRGRRGRRGAHHLFVVHPEPARARRAGVPRAASLFGPPVAEEGQEVRIPSESRPLARGVRAEGVEPLRDDAGARSADRPDAVGHPRFDGELDPRRQATGRVQANVEPDERREVDRGGDRDRRGERLVPLRPEADLLGGDGRDEREGEEDEGAAHGGSCGGRGPA